ncbi:MAG: hypothetical protein AB7U45_05270 [Desulfamplus sp.]
MQVIEYTTDISSNGTFSIPAELFKKIQLKKNSQVRILVLYEEPSYQGESPSKKGIKRFCGKWQDDRDAHEIIDEIYQSRSRNSRSEEYQL